MIAYIALAITLVCLAWSVSSAVQARRYRIQAEQARDRALASYAQIEALRPARRRR